MENGIFEGLKVLDCASFIAAPAAATVLSDFGAEVIKIEPPGAGDPYRNLPNLPGYPHSPHNFAWMLDSRNKKSLALDLSKPDGQSVLHRLVAEAGGPHYLARFATEQTVTVNTSAAGGNAALMTDME